ncbi:hypothetical protein [Streptomyces sp. NPDC059247]|uniref:hypothetical protein n=1 Tax=Streptomyces sp. NPDC059247 TaxID=3346790 RepID=UPI00368D61DF
MTNGPCPRTWFAGKARSAFHRPLSRPGRAPFPTVAHPPTVGDGRRTALARERTPEDTPRSRGPPGGAAAPAQGPLTPVPPAAAPSALAVVSLVPLIN